MTSVQTQPAPKTQLEIEVRPQPLGVFPFPTGLLLLPPAGPGALAGLGAILAGDLPGAWPEEWRFYQLALDSKNSAALGCLEEDARPIAAYNRFVLRGEDHPVPVGISPALAALYQSARYALGYSDEPPASTESLDSELLAYVLMLRATRLLETGCDAEAVQDLRRGVDACSTVAPALAYQLLTQLAHLEQNNPIVTIGYYKQAALLAPTSAKADPWLQIGMLWQEMGRQNPAALPEAVKAYQEALRCGVSIESDPEQFALIQNNLALAYLAMPMVQATDQLRMAVAVQSLREALKVYQKETHPEQWASAQLNLANALQYVPTSHPEENLIAAVEIYEQVLTVRTRAFDPLGYARVLSNQANALAHLGIFGPAVEKISEAYKLFHWHDETEMAATTKELLDTITAQRAMNEAK